MHTSEMVLTNNKTGGIDRTTQVFVVSAEPIEDNKVIEDYARVAVAPGEYIGLSFHGEVITAAGAGTMTVLKQQKNESAQYTLRLEGTTFNFNGVGGGVKAIAKSINSDIRLSSNDYANGRGNTINTAAVNNGFGFSMEMTPSISSEAIVLNVKINNSSLIGYQASGQPRIQKNAEINTNFMISNSGTKLVIGGIEKRDVVSISGGVPILKDLPVIGWIFSTESESTKKSQLLVVAEVIPVKAGETYTAAEKKALQELDEKLNKAGESNTFGYRQFFIDADRVK